MEREKLSWTNIFVSDFFWLIRSEIEIWICEPESDTPTDPKKKKKLRVFESFELVMDLLRTSWS